MCPEIICPVLYFENLARAQICVKIIKGENYDYLTLFYILGELNHTFNQRINHILKFSDEYIEGREDEFVISWKDYRFNFNYLAYMSLGVEDFLDEGDREEYKKVFSKKDLERYFAVKLRAVREDLRAIEQRAKKSL